MGGGSNLDHVCFKEIQDASLGLACPFCPAQSANAFAKCHVGLAILELAIREVPQLKTGILSIPLMSKAAQDDVLERT